MVISNSAGTINSAVVDMHGTVRRAITFSGVTMLVMKPVSHQVVFGQAIRNLQPRMMREADERDVKMWNLMSFVATLDSPYFYASSGRTYFRPWKKGIVYQHGAFDCVFMTDGQSIHGNPEFASAWYPHENYAMARRKLAKVKRGFLRAIEEYR
jgi:hypothetical protein